MGFGKSDAEASRDKATKALGEFLRPEFISRVDEIVYFRPLKREDYSRIADLMLKELVQPLAERDIAFSWTSEAAGRAGSQGFRRQTWGPGFARAPSGERWRTKSLP